MKMLPMTTPGEEEEEEVYSSSSNIYDDVYRVVNSIYTCN